MLSKIIRPSKGKTSSLSSSTCTKQPRTPWSAACASAGFIASRSPRKSEKKTARPPRASRSGGVPPPDRMAHGGRAVFFSDFLGDIEAMKPALAHAADQGVRGCFVQVLDESEEVFPFDGRMIFESMGGTTEFETQRARALREAYAERLAERRAKIVDYARHLGWRWLFHHTSQPPRPALLWLYMAVGERA